MLLSADISLIHAQSLELKTKVIDKPADSSFFYLHCIYRLKGWVVKA